MTSGGSGAGAAAGSSAVAPGAGGTGNFGNPTGPAKMVGDGTMHSGDCLEPTVAFVIDGSGSMCEKFGSGTRWSELRKVLMDPMNGLIYRFQNQVDFSLMLYDGTIDFMAASMATNTSPNPMCAGLRGAMRNMGQCPQMVQVPASRTNARAIDMMYPAQELGGSTPTDKAMNVAVDQLIAANPGADPAVHPKFLILATDGQPNDICTGGVGGDGTAQQAGVIAAVDRAAQAGIRTYVISLAGGDPGLEAHLTMVAMHGDPTNPGARSYSPAAPDELLMTMKVLLGNALGCAVM